MQAYDYVRMIVELAKYSLEKSNHEFIDDWTKFVTHLFYMDNPRIPLDVDKLQAKGIQCIAIRRDAFLIDRYDLSDLQEKLQQIHEAND